MWRKFKCLIGEHDWTCRAEEGIKPDVTAENFIYYATCYCKHCRKLNQFSVGKSVPEPWEYKAAAPGD